MTPRNGNGAFSPPKVLNCRSVVIHVFKRTCRKKFPWDSVKGGTGCDGSFLKSSGLGSFPNASFFFTDEMLAGRTSTSELSYDTFYASDPKTLVLSCLGAMGNGKSSLLNAICDEQIYRTGRGAEVSSPTQPSSMY
jgi:hypothetical protein